MLLKILTSILAVLVVAVSGYAIWNRHPVNRFKPVDEDGYLAFDTATGQLCRTYRAKSPPKRIPSAPSSDRSDGLRPEDRILDAIETKGAEAAANAKAERDAQVELIRGLPACADIC